MGLGDFLKQIKTRYPHCIQETYLEVFAGKNLAFEVSVYAYKYMAVARSESIKYIDVLREDPNPATLRAFWLEKYFNVMTMFIESKITPIAVFDGVPFHLKDCTKNEREEKKEARRKLIASLRDEINDDPEADHRLKRVKLEREVANHITFVKEDWEALRQMFDSMGIPCLKLPFEAEAVCARLVRRGYAAGVISTDADTLAHLSGIMIREVKRHYKMSVPYHKCTCIVLSDVMESLKLNHIEFVEFCMLVGTDYNQRVKGYGFKKCLDLIQEHKKIEVVVDILRKKISASNARYIKQDKPEKVVDFEKYRLDNPDLRIEIFDYFYKTLIGEIEFPLVLNYQDGLLQCVQEIFDGSKNLSRMEKKASEIAPRLKDFNQQFAAMQKFVIVKAGDVE